MNDQLEPVRATGLMTVQQVGIRDLVTVLFRRRWLIVAVAVPIIIAATLMTIRSTDFFTASARLMLQLQQPENPTFDRGFVDYQLVLSSASQIAMSTPVAELAAASLLDTMRTLAKRDPRLSHLTSQRTLEDALLAGVGSGQVGESNLLSIQYSHPVPEFCLLAVAALVDGFIDFSIRSQQNVRAVDYYTEQIDALQRGVDSLMSKRASLRNAAGYTALATNAQAGIAQIMTLEQEYLKARTNRESLEASIEGLRTAIAENPDYVPGVRSGENQNLVGQKYRLDEAEAKLASLRVQYQDDSEWVQRQRQIVAEARAYLHNERDSFLRDLQIRLDEAKRVETAYAAAMERQKAALANYPDYEAQIESIDIQLLSQRELLRDLQVKRGEVRLKAGTDVRISNILRVDRPTLASAGTRSKKLLYLALAGVFALGLGIVVAFFTDAQDHRLYDKRQAERYLNVPVLGAVSEVTLGEDGRARRG